MTILRKLIALTLLGGSTLFAALIIVGQKELTITIPEAMQASLNEPKNEALTDVPELIDTENITRETVTAISKGIFEKNPNGIQTIEGQEWLSVMSPEEAVEKYFAEAIKKFDINELKTPADQSKLVISKDTNSQALTSYIQGFQTTLNANFKGLRIDYKNLSVEKIDTLIAAYNKAISELYTLTVPQSLVAIHLQQITLMNGQRNVFVALRQSESDPMRAILAAEANKEISKEFAVINKALQDIIQKNNLTL